MTEPAAPPPDRWARPSAPGPLGTTLAGLSLALVPAVLGTVLDWPVLLTLGLMAGGLFLIERASRRGARTRGLRAPSALNRLEAPIGGVTVALTAWFVPQRYWCLVVVAFVAAWLAVERAWWRRRDQAA
jgi:hypothetical protein